MGFVTVALVLLTAVIVVAVYYVVEIVIQIVETIIHLIMIILGWKPDSQTIEYYEVHNIPLFTDEDIASSQNSTVLASITNNTSIASFGTCCTLTNDDRVCYI